MDDSRIILRCFSEDLGLALPDVDSELAADHPMVDELVTRAPTAPAGLKRILAIGTPLVYRLRRGRHRGVRAPSRMRMRTSPACMMQDVFSRPQTTPRVSTWRRRLESAAGPGEWEAVSAWPEGELSWFEVARYGLLEA